MTLSFLVDNLVNNWKGLLERQGPLGRP